MVCPAVFGRRVLPTGFCRPAVSLQTDGEFHRNEHGKEGFRAAGAYARNEKSQSYPIDRGGPCVWQGQGSMDLSVGGKAMQETDAQELQACISMLEKYILRLRKEIDEKQ